MVKCRTESFWQRSGIFLFFILFISFFSFLFRWFFVQVETKQPGRNGEMKTVNETFKVGPEENVPLKIL